MLVGSGPGQVQGCAEASLEHMEDGLSQLEPSLDTDAKLLLNAAKATGQEFWVALEGLRNKIDVERKARLGREGQLLQQLKLHSKEFAAKHKKAWGERTAAMAGLQASIKGKEEHWLQQ